MNKKNVLITGASSGLGEALALEFAGNDTRLFLTARNLKRLENTVNQCKAKGAEVIYETFDLKNYEFCTYWIEKILALYIKIDIIIANAGVSGGTLSQNESTYQIKEILETNIFGSLNIINPIIINMQKQQDGQIVFIGSMAGLLPMAGCPAYSASKSAIHIYGQALRIFLAKHNIKVTTVIPGYISTPMTKVNKFPMPLIINANSAAKLIVKKLSKNPSFIIFPLPIYFLIKIVTFLPNFLLEKLIKIFPAKKALK